MSILLAPEEIAEYISDCGTVPVDPNDVEFIRTVAKEQARQIHKWGEEICLDVDHENYRTFKHECRDCWQEFRAELEG